MMPSFHDLLLLWSIYPLAPCSSSTAIWGLGCLRPPGLLLLILRRLSSCWGSRTRVLWAYLECAIWLFPQFDLAHFVSGLNSGQSLADARVPYLTRGEKICSLQSSYLIVLASCAEGAPERCRQSSLLSRTAWSSLFPRQCQVLCLTLQVSS